MARTAMLTCGLIQLNCIILSCFMFSCDEILSSGFRIVKSNIHGMQSVQQCLWNTVKRKKQHFNSNLFVETRLVKLIKPVNLVLDNCNQYRVILK
jgi:hypothetical protein